MKRERIGFTKMHGAGNDYIYVDTLLYNIVDPCAASLQWSDRHTGVGADGLVLIGAPTDASVADFSMRIFNADGSEAMMCGNASRCVGKYVFERGLTRKREIRLDTRSGMRLLRLNVSGDVVESVTVDMGVPRLHCPEQYDEAFGNVLSAAFRSFRGTFVSMGNPHFVVFVDDVESFDVERYGALLECHEAFPDRCNIEFAQMSGNNTIRMRVWERGSGITQACGTGACATAVAAACLPQSKIEERLPRISRKGRVFTVVADGGRLNIEWGGQDSHVYMTGPATFVFDGEIEGPTPSL